eukprot:12036495-Alexandrium_andersonii.AAC.1
MCIRDRVVGICAAQAIRQLGRRAPSEFQVDLADFVFREGEPCSVQRRHAQVFVRDVAIPSA